MAMNQPFTTASQAIASYNYTDISSGTGFNVYYAANTSDDYVLTTTTYYSKNVISYATSTGTTPDTKLIDIDFDIVFNKPQEIEGEVLVNVPVGVYNYSGATRTPTRYAIVKIRKWDGTTETEIANNTGTSTSEALSDTASWRAMDAINVTVPYTHFAEGETLRVTIEYYGWGNGTPFTADFFIGHDPNNRAQSGYDKTELTFDTSPSQLAIHIPFRLNL